MYKLNKVEEIGGSVSVTSNGMVILLCQVGDLEFALEFEAMEDAYMVRITEATWCGCMIHHAQTLGRIDTWQGAVNFLTQQLPTVKFDDYTVRAISHAAECGWREPSVAHDNISELLRLC